MGKPASEQVIFQCIKKLKAAFPALVKDFFTILIERVKYNNFTDERLIDATNHVIDHCPYLTPQIADLISFDRKFKVWNYDEMLAKNDEYGPEIWQSYKAIKIPGNEKPVWAHVNDIKQYGLTTVNQ